MYYLKRDLNQFGYINPKLYALFVVLGNFISCVALFMIDGIFIAPSNKLVIPLTAAILLSFFGILNFFNWNENDYQYNLFSNSSNMSNQGFGKYANINFKSIYLSSLSNIVLFSLKPILRECYLAIRQCINGSIDSSINININSNYNGKLSMKTVGME